MSKSIFLIGYRATGKTTVAPLLAARLGYEAIDADIEIERLAGKSIAEIFASEGEAGFRDREAEVVAALSKRPRSVVSLGGGAVLNERSRRFLRESGPIVLLSASVETIHARLTGDTTTASRRPRLTPAGGREEIEALLRARMPIYRECATFEIDTEGKSPEGVTEEILERLDLP